MYKYKVERDQQQNTILTFHHCSSKSYPEGNIVMVKCCRITQIYLHHPQNSIELAIARTAVGFYCALES